MFKTMKIRSLNYSGKFNFVSKIKENALGFRKSFSIQGKYGAMNSKAFTS